MTTCFSSHRTFPCLQKLVTKEQSLTDLDAQNAKLLKEVKQREAAFMSLQQQLEIAKRSTTRSGVSRGTEDRLRSEISALENKLSTMKAEFVGIRATTDGSSSLVSKEADMWKSRSESLALELRTAQDEVIKIRVDEQTLRGKCANLLDTNQKLESKIKQSEEEIDSLRGLGTQATGDLRRKLQSKEDEMAILLEEHDIQASELMKVQRKLSQVIAEKQSLESVIDTLKCQIEKYKKDKEEAQVECRRLSELVDDKTIEIDNIKFDMKEQKAALDRRDTQYNLLTSQLNATRGEVADAEAGSRLLVKHQDETAVQLSEAAEQLKITRERAERAEGAAEELRKQVMEAKAAQESIDGQLKITIAALDEATGNAGEKTKQAGNLSADNDTLKQHISKLESKLEESKKELAEQKEAMERVTAELDNAQFESSQRAKELEDASCRLGEAEKAINSTKTRSSEETAELRVLLEAKATECDALFARVSELEASLKEAEQLRVLAEQKSEQLAVQLQNAKEEHESTKDQLAAVADQASALERGVERRESELGDAGKKLAQTDALLQQISSLTTQMHEGHSALQAATEQITVINDELEEARAAIRAKQEALDKAHGAVADKDRKLIALETELKQQQTAVRVLERRIEDREEKATNIEAGMTSVQVESADLKSALRDRELEVVDLRKEVEEALKEAEVARKEAAEAQELMNAERKRAAAIDYELANADDTTQSFTAMKLDSVTPAAQALASAHAVNVVEEEELDTQDVPLSEGDDDEFKEAGSALSAENEGKVIPESVNVEADSRMGTDEN